MAPLKYRARISAIALAAVAALCGVLGFLQYRWIGEVRNAQRDRLREELQGEITGVSRAFNRQVDDALRNATPGVASTVFRDVEETDSPPPHGVLGRLLDAGPTPRWLRAELNLDWVRQKALPPLLAARGLGEFDVQVVTADPAHAELIYTNGPDRIMTEPDASTPILDVPFGRGGPGPFRGGPEGGFHGGRRGPPPNEPGIWRLLARHKNGSLEAVVAATQRRNLGVSGAILLLILGVAAMLIRVTRQAQQLADAHIGFVAGVSHELRTPLTVIRTAAFNLGSGKIQSRPDQIERYGRLIAAETEKLEALVDQVLRFAAGRAGHALGEVKPLAVAALIEDEVNALRPAAEKDGVAVLLSIDPSLPLAMADDRALRTALRNLLDNALRYGRSGREIRISAKPAACRGVPFIEIEVADSGPGIPAAEIGRVFEPFFRGSGAVRDQIHGTGLGLNIVRTIAEAHGGSVGVTSSAGSGTYFCLRIPCAEHRSIHAHPVD